MNVTARRPDGSFVADINGPYHVTLDDPLFAQADPADIAAAPLDQPVTVPDPGLPLYVTKLQIRDEAEANYPGMWTAIKAFVAADADRQERWDLATEIRTTDPLIDDMQAALGWSNEQRETFLTAAGTR